jgi:uncharacterized protein (TIGR03118 family)
MSMKFVARPAGLVRNLVIAAVVAIVVACGGAGVSLRPTSPYTLSLLVSDGWTDAAHADARLRNPWGLVAAPGGAMWVANNLDHTITQYDGTGVAKAQVVNADVAGFAAGDVTGIAASNSDSDFMIDDGMTTAPAKLLFVTASGSLRGWASGADAVEIDSVPGLAGTPQFTGLAIASTAGGTHGYVADFGLGAIHVFDEEFAWDDATDRFVDADLPKNYSPWNIKAIQRLGTTVLAVAYAKRDAISGDVVTGPGFGAINLFDTDGKLLTRLVRPGGRLDAPWGLAVAPAVFGALSEGLLVASTGEGLIKGFDLLNGAFLGTTVDAREKPLVVDGLRGIAFGNGFSNQPTNVLFVTAGSNDGADGLYARFDSGTEVPDIIAPNSVAVTAPVGGATVSGHVDVTAGASDNVGVVRVEFFAEAGGKTRPIGTATAAPFGINWNSGTVPDGPVSLTARAFDANGNSTLSAAAGIAVDNPPGVLSPTVSIATPAAGNASGVVTVSANAEDDVGVAEVEFFDGADSLGTDFTAPYSVLWNATGLTGTRDLTAVATDGEGNKTTSEVVQVNVVVSTVTLVQLQQTIFSPLCARCHNGTDDGLASRLILTSAGASYSSLVGQPSEKDPGLQRVEPGNPGASSLIRILEGSSINGTRMPTGGPYLDQATLDKVRTWIQAGAKQ